MKRRILTGGFLLLVVAGCAAPITGQPNGSASSSQTAGPTTSGESVGIDVVDLDPCAAIRPEQAKALGVGAPKSGVSSRGTKSCRWSHFQSEPIESYYVDSSDRLGIGSINAVGEPFTVGRYKAVIGRSQSAGFETVCQIAIDVHPGQILQVNYGYEGTTQRMTHDLACEKAKPVAAMVIANLDRGGN